MSATIEQGSTPNRNSQPNNGGNGKPIGTSSNMLRAFVLAGAALVVALNLRSCEHEKPKPAEHHHHVLHHKHHPVHKEVTAAVTPQATAPAPSAGPAPAAPAPVQAQISPEPVAPAGAPPVIAASPGYVAVVPVIPFVVPDSGGVVSGGGGWDRDHRHRNDVHLDINSDKARQARIDGLTNWAERATPGFRALPPGGFRPLPQGGEPRFAQAPRIEPGHAPEPGRPPEPGRHLDGQPEQRHFYSPAVHAWQGFRPNIAGAYHRIMGPAPHMGGGKH